MVVVRAAVIASLVAAAPRAAAADVGVVVVGAPGAPSSDADVRTAIGDALARAGETPRPDAADDARAAADAGAVPAGALASFARVRELTDEGWRAYLQVQTEFALARLGDARREAEAVLALDGGLASYADAALRLGAALDNAGRHGEADDVLRLAVALDPARTITAVEFSPDVVSAVARATASHPATRALAVSVPGATGATIEIDGGAATAAPAQATLPLGQHVVIARAPGRAPHGQTVALTAGDGAQSIEIALDPDPAAALAERPEPGQSERDAAAWIDAATIYADLDAVVLVASVWRGGKPALLAQWCDGSPATCTVVVEIGHDDGGLAAAARETVAELARARSGRRYPPTLPSDARLTRAEHHVIEHPRRCRWCRPALYAGGGVAAVLVTVGVIALVTSGQNGTVVSIDPSDF